MKRELILFITATCAFLSCSKSELVSENDSLSTKHFYAETPKEETKAYIDSDYNIHWTADDRISVFCSTTNEQYRFIGQTGDLQGTFENVSTPVSQTYTCNYAIYPYHTENTCSEDGEMELSLPSSQSYAENSFGLGSNTMVAVTENLADETFKFKSCCGYLMLKLYGGERIKSITLRGNNNEKIAGTAKVNAVYGEIPTVEMSDDASAEIILSCPQEGVSTNESAEQYTQFWFVLPPTTFSKGFTIDITNTDDNVFTCSTDNSITINRNRILKMAPIKVDAQNAHKMLSFSLSDGKDIYTAFDIRDNVINVQVPNGTDMTNMTASFKYNGASVKVNDLPQTSGENSHDFSDFVNPVKYVVTSPTGETQEYKVMMFDIPVLLIDTPDGEPITSKEVRVEGCEMKTLEESGEIVNLGTAGIKVRGNSTATLPKKPYNIKLDSKAKVFGLGSKKSKHWVMLANCYYDRTQLHNAVAYKFAKMTDYPWVQDGTFCDLILNGEYVGMYYICEKVRIENGRIELTEIEDGETSEESLTGAYLMETTIFPETEAETPYFTTEYYNTSNGYTYYWCFDSPEENISQNHINYIKGRLDNLTTLIHEQETTPSDDYLDYLDIETMINWFLVEEACQNEEASRSKNVWIYKDRNNEKFYLGPPWDFDAWTFGYLGNGDRWVTKDYSLFLPGLFKNADFVQRVKEKWTSYKQIWMTDGIAFFDEQREYIHNSALRNDAVWTQKKGWVEGYSSLTYDEYVDKMRASILSRINWIDSHLSELDVE